METVPEEDKAEKKKITQLLLNTPGACFLCLKDNVKDDEGVPEEDLNGGIIDLSTVCRYLNINQCSLLLTSLKNDGGSGVEDLQQHSCTFSVNLCQKCLKLTEKLNETIVQLEKAKLMVNFHLQTFHKVLEGKRKDERLEWIDLQKRLNAHSDNSMEAKLAQLLREDAKDKSYKILKKAEKAIPQVIVSKCEIPPLIPPTVSYPPITSDSASIKSLLSHLIATNAIPSSKKSHKSKLHRCPYCTKVMGYSKISEHLSCLHSDKLISSHFLPPSLPPSEEICRQVLYSQVVAKAAKFPSTCASTKPRLACHLCGITYSDGNLLKQHFLITHTEQLCEEIINFGKKPQKIRKLLNQPKIITKQPISKVKRLRGSEEENKTCTICRQTFSKFDKLQRHLVTQHPDQLFLECKPSWMGVEQFRGICKGIFRREVREATYGKPGDKIYKCGYCPGEKTSYKGQDYLVVHLAYQHRMEMEEKLKQDELNWRMDDIEGTGEEDEGGDHMVIEEDASEFDMKPDIGELDKMMYEDKMLDELISNEADDLQQQYAYFEENGSGGGDCEVDDNGTTGNMTDEQLELPDNQSANPVIKMEAVIPDEYYN